MYGGTKAMLNRWTVSLALELVGSGVAANTLAPQRSTATEAVSMFVEKGRLRAEDMEPIETMVEAALALCVCDPAELTGQVCYSLSLLERLQRPVLDLRGVSLVDGWQPADIRTYRGASLSQERRQRRPGWGGRR